MVAVVLIVHRRGTLLTSTVIRIPPGQRLNFIPLRKRIY